MLSLTQKFSSNLIKIILPSRNLVILNQTKDFSKSSVVFCAAVESNSDQSTETPIEDAKRLAKDRTKVIPVETSIKYLKSAAYTETYGKYLVWEQYRRNHKGLFPPKRTRKTCIRKGALSTGNPCPICRDEYLVLDHRNIDLLKQFISPQSGRVLSYTKTGVCQKKHLELLVAVERAMDYGLLTFDVPFRKYDYSEYYGELNKSN